jgi:uncharacterized protein
MIHLLNFPELRQIFNYDCGACASQCILEYYGIDIREDEIMKRLKTDPEKGSPWKRIIRLFESFGLKTQHGQFEIDFLIKSINEQHPVLIALQAYRDDKNIDWKDDFNDGHYVTAIGYNKKHIIFEDPSSVNRAYLPFDELNERWHDIDPSTNKVLEHFGIMTFGLEPKFHNKFLVKLE